MCAIIQLYFFFQEGLFQKLYIIFAEQISSDVSENSDCLLFDCRVVLLFAAAVAAIMGKQ